MPTFQDSLAVGKASEEVVLAWIKKKYPAYQLEGYCKQADIVFYKDSRWESCEVKQDFRSDETGNWVIELSFGGNDSGIMTTGATYWVLVDHTNMHFITPMQILRCIAKNKETLRIARFIGPGDEKEKETYLIPKRTLEKYVSFVIPY